MIIIKIGGGAALNLKGIVADLATLNDKLILVHGANALRDELAERLKIPKKTVTSLSGYDSVLSDESTIDLQMLAYAGLRNKRLVELCQQHGINAVGLSGLDGKVIQGKRNSGIKVEENGKKKILRDFSGKPQTVNKHLLNLLLENGYTPVLSVPILDESNFAINSENDDIVNVLQRELGAAQIIQLIESPGLLAEKDQPDSLIKTLSLDGLIELEHRLEGRIKRKLLALRKLMETGAPKIYISDGRTEHPIHDALAGKGTVLE
jgi:acetylglutamate/LysW-gamma-L-alpha-aminoadipate kinase